MGSSKIIEPREQDGMTRSALLIFWILLSPHPPFGHLPPTGEGCDKDFSFTFPNSGRTFLPLSPISGKTLSPSCLPLSGKEHDPPPLPSPSGEGGPLAVDEVPFPPPHFRIKGYKKPAFTDYPLALPRQAPSLLPLRQVPFPSLSLYAAHKRHAPCALRRAVSIKGHIVHNRRPPF